MISKQKKDIPPGLLRIVKGSKPSKKFFLLLVLSLFLVISGFGAVYFYTQYVTPEIKNQLKSKQTVTQSIPQVPVQSQEIEPTKEINKEIKTSEKIKPPEKHQKQPNTIKVAQKDVQLASVDTFRGADYLYRAQDYEQKGMLKDAINEYKEYINYSGKAEAKILNKIATLYLLAGNFKEADNYIEIAIQGNKNNKEMLINYGVIKAKMGELNKAEETFNKVLSLEPENRNALFNLALIKEQKGEYKEALRLYEKLYQLGDLSAASSLERLKAYR